MQIIDHLPLTAPGPCVATIGFFDGVHCGHRYLIEQVKSEARKAGMSSMLITFSVHPRKVMNPGFHPELLTPQNEKLGLLAKTGVDYCVVLDFTPAIAILSAREFMEDILYNHCGVRSLLIGYDHRFGRGRSESFEDYLQYGKQIGIDIIQTAAYQPEGVYISSSYIRQCLKNSLLSKANEALDYPYFLDGVVTGGYQIGRKLGFPTANLLIDDADKLIPADGVYAVEVHLGNGMNYAGMLNIGQRPTIDNGMKRTIEVHILDFNGDLYDQTIRLSLTHFIRPEVKFGSLDDLVAQLHRDEAAVRQLTTSH